MVHSCDRLDSSLNPLGLFCLRRTVLKVTSPRKASDEMWRSEMQEVSIQDITTIPPPCRSGNANPTVGGDDLRTPIGGWCRRKGKRGRQNVRRNVETHEAMYKPQRRDEISSLIQCYSVSVFSEILE